MLYILINSKVISDESAIVNVLNEYFVTLLNLYTFLSAFH